MKLTKKITALVLGILFLTGCSFVGRISDYINSVSTSSSSSSSKTYEVTSTFCANAVNTPVSYTSSKKREMNLSTVATDIYAEAHKSAITVNACYSVAGYEYNYITSGVVYEKEDNNYYIVTNSSGIFHRYYKREGFITSDSVNVVRQGDYEIDFDDGRRYMASLVGYYDNADIAVFAFTTTDDVAVAKIGSSDTLELGDSVVALGTPSLGSSLMNTFVRGTVSGLSRRQFVTYEEVINGITRSFDVCDYEAFQFDAPINGGMEGGPVYDSTGSLVGLISYKYTNTSSSVDYESMSMALPIDNVKNVIANIIKSGSYTRPTIGITISELREFTIATRQEYGIPDSITEGAFIVTVTSGSCASKAKMSTGEVVIGVNDKSIVGIAGLSGQLIRYNIGDTIKIKTLTLAGEEQVYEVKL